MCPIISFSQPVGRFLDPERVAGYYVDFSVKAESPDWPPGDPAEALHVWIAQWALGCLERHTAGEGERWLAGATGAARYLLEIQAEDGGWPHPRPFPHTYRLEPQWLSAMMQGEGASVLVRVADRTGDERFAEAAGRALGPLLAPFEEGGLNATLGDGRFPQEYPTTPPAHVLNGGIFSLWGLRDVALALGSESAMAGFEHGLDCLAGNLSRWDCGYWSRYDLFPHPLMNVATPAYHQLHIDQLRAMNLVAPRPELEAMAGRFSEYAASRSCRARAFATKVAFRLRVPRNRLFSHRLSRS